MPEQLLMCNYSVITEGRFCLMIVMKYPLQYNSQFCVNLRKNT